MRITLLLLCVSACIPIFAQDAKPVAAMPPDGFAFTGVWDCAGSFRGDKTHRATFTGSVILAGKWLELTEQDNEPATGYVAKYLIGYDPQQKRLVEFDANNFGAATYTSIDGWNGRVLTMTSPASTDKMAPYSANRFVYSITGTDAFTVDWEISKTTGQQWSPADHLACKRHR